MVRVGEVGQSGRRAMSSEDKAKQKRKEKKKEEKKRETSY
jgi:hypothetical protein